MKNSQEGLAIRRRALVARCAIQRMDMQSEAGALLAPIDQAGAMLGRVNWKLAWVAGAAALGFLAFRPTRAISMVTTGVSLFKMGSALLARRS